MNKPAAFRATYSDLKLIKTRQCVQIVFELPLADFKVAYEILGGLPDLPNETWFAIAPLKLPPAEKETSSTTLATPEAASAKPPSPVKRMDWRDLQPAAQAGIRCDDPVFQSYLREERGQSWVNSNAQAAEYVRRSCEAKSRSELSTDHRKRVLWHQLDSQFLAWKELGRT